jgi:hypothetical protein
LNFVNGFSVGTDTHHKFVHIRQDSSTTKHQVLIQNRTNDVSTAGIAFIASGSDFSDGQYAAIECLSGGTGTTSQSLKFVTSASGGTPATALTIGSDQVMTGGTFHLGGSQILSSGASLQVNGFMRTGTIYLHQGGGTPNSSSVEFKNLSQQPYWDTNKIWHAGNDGAGSGLDADLWDGNQFASYLNQAVLTTSTPSFNQVITTNNGNGTNVRIGDDAWIGDINRANTIRVQGMQNGANGYIVFGNSNTTALGRAGTGALTYGGNTVWHTGNDGAGSTLDADKLDSQEGSYYLNYNNFTNTPTIPTNNNQLTNGAGYITNGANYNVNDSWLRENGDNAHVKIYGNSRQMVFRTDGETEFSSGVGAYAFAWMYGGDAAGNRRMLLDDNGDLWTSNNGWLSSALSGKAASSHSHSYQAAANELSWVDQATGNYGTIKVDDDRSVTWAGYAIRDDWVFMSSGAETAGIYNDTDNEWAVLCRRNAEVELSYNAAVQAETANGYFLANNQCRSPSTMTVQIQLRTSMLMALQT